MATRRREFFAVAARVGLRLAAAAAEEEEEEGEELWDSFLRPSDDDALDSSVALLERKGFEVKKCRFRGRLAGAVRWNERRGRREVIEL